jgi:hypothetical protein
MRFWISFVLHSAVLFINGKAVLLQAWSGPEDSRKLRFPYFMTMHKMVVRSALCTGRLYPQEMLLYSFLLKLKLKNLLKEISKWLAKFCIMIFGINTFV